MVIDKVELRGMIGASEGNDYERGKTAMFVEFFDMHSGGGMKCDSDYIYIEAVNIDAAIEKFQEIYGRDPRNTTCDCCGPDYDIYEVENIDHIEESAVIHSL